MFVVNRSFSDSEQRAISLHEYSHAKRTVLVRSADIGEVSAAETLSVGLLDRLGIAKTEISAAARERLFKAIRRAAERGERATVVLGHLRPWRAVSARPAREPGYVALQVHVGEPLDDGRAEAISDALDLSSAEASVAVHLSSGLTVDQIAARRGVSPETVRSQVKSIFAKTGVNSQKQVAALVQYVRCVA